MNYTLQNLNETKSSDCYKVTFRQIEDLMSVLEVFNAIYKLYEETENEHAYDMLTEFIDDDILNMHNLHHLVLFLSRQFTNSDFKKHSETFLSFLEDRIHYAISFLEDDPERSEELKEIRKHVNY